MAKKRSWDFYQTYGGAAYLDAENRIKDALNNESKILDLSNFGKETPRFSELPESICLLENLEILNLSYNRLSDLPNFISTFKSLRVIILHDNIFKEIPSCLQKIKSLREISLFNNYIEKIPLWIGEFKELTELDISNNKLSFLPDTIGDLIYLEELYLSENNFVTLPDSIGNLNSLKELRLSDCGINSLPWTFNKLSELTLLDLSHNKLKELPERIEHLQSLRDLDISSNQLIQIPSQIRKLNKLEKLKLDSNQIKDIPEWIGEISSLKDLSVGSNKIETLPKTIGTLSKLEVLNLYLNPIKSLPRDVIKLKKLKTLYINSQDLSPDLAEAVLEGLDSIKLFLKAGPVHKTREAKLIVVGDGGVGKTCLIDALQDNVWQEHSTTHGIQIQKLEIMKSWHHEIYTFNCWDFSGQHIYRSTHQLFFSAPAIYLVVWKPRDGVQAGQVKEWIQLIKRRTKNPKILIVATHGGPYQNQPDIDRQEIWDLFSKEAVVDFFVIDNKPDINGKRKGIDNLRKEIADTAWSLINELRSIPKVFADVRRTLQEIGVPYLSLQEVLAICRSHNMDDEVAKLFIIISHRLGHLTYYENDHILRDIVILRPDWLATAMSYVLDDEETRAKHGMVNFSRLSQLWNDSARPPEYRYPEELHPIFLRLMERFDLSYRVKDPYARDESDPISLIGQLVPDVRPSNLPEAWGEFPYAGDIQQTQICRIVDAGNGQSANAEGLFYQLIVRLHKYSLGRADYKASVHWQRGLVLEDEFKNRALLEHVGNDVRITVRSPFPEGLLGMLTREVKYLVESFWEGLRCDIMVPCLSPCGKTPGTGMFEVEKLMVFKKQGMTMFPCMVSGCNQAQNIDLLLRNAPAASQAISIAELQSEFTAIKDKLDEVSVTSRRILSQVDKTYTDLLQVLTDEAKEGPRLFSFFPVDRSNFNPKTWIREKFRLVLWCEHSRLPLPALNGANSKEGVYDLELDREWFKKSAPYLKFLTGTLGMVLPVASSSVKLALDEAAYKLIEEQLDFGKSVIDAAIGTSGNVNDFMSKADVTDLEHGVASRADGSTLRELHALLKSKDPGFGGLVRVMNKRQEFLWVHERFAGEY
jgi:Leucine-rich repeat (LRR) protein